MSGFHGAFATGVACQQGTLTLPDTWFRPPFWDLLMLQLLRPNSSNSPCLYSTFHLEYPLVLSRFCLVRSYVIIHEHYRYIHVHCIYVSCTVAKKGAFHMCHLIQFQIKYRLKMYCRLEALDKNVISKHNYINHHVVFMGNVFKYSKNTSGKNCLKIYLYYSEISFHIIKVCRQSRKTFLFLFCFLLRFPTSVGNLSVFVLSFII